MLARAHLNSFTTSDGKDFESLDKAHDCFLQALTGASSLDVRLPASTAAVSTDYTRKTVVRLRCAVICCRWCCRVHGT